MGERTKIEWADGTANFWEGCTKVSPGCANCYAESLLKRAGKDFGDIRRTKGPWTEAGRLNRKAAKPKE